MKSMDFAGWLGERSRHSRSYGDDEQQRQAAKDAISCNFFGETDYQAPRPGLQGLLTLSSTHIGS